MKHCRVFSILSALLFVAYAGGASASLEVQNDERGGGEHRGSFSFVVIGCNRVDAADVSPDNPSTANLEQLNRTFREIAELRPLPQFLFFAGDMVFGYSSDVSVTQAQLKAWRSVYESSSLPDLGVELVAIPGNHEVQGDAPRHAYLEAENAWLTVMAPFITRGGNGPHAGEEDQLTTDQSALTYSFDYRGVHFLLLDTDPVDWDWRVPVRWIEQDLRRASEGGARHIFAIGHKPAFPWPGSPMDGLAMYPSERDDFWSSLENNNAEAMFAAHNHVWFKQQPNEGGTWQIIAGNGGSILEAGVTGDDRYYGFTLVTVGRRGSVVAESFGRDVPAEGYRAPSDAYPTTIRDTVSLSR